MGSADGVGGNAHARFNSTYPSGVAASLPPVRAKRAGRARIARPYGVAPRPFMLQWQVGGSRKAGPRLYARSAS